MDKKVHCRFCGRPLMSPISKKKGAGEGCLKKRRGKQKKFSFATQFPKKPKL